MQNCIISKILLGGYYEENIATSRNLLESKNGPRDATLGPEGLRGSGSAVKLPGSGFRRNPWIHY